METTIKDEKQANKDLQDKIKSNTSLVEQKAENIKDLTEEK